MKEFISENPRLFAFTVIAIVLILTSGSYYGCTACIDYHDRKNNLDRQAKEACLRSGGQVVAPDLLSNTEESWICKK